MIARENIAASYLYGVGPVDAITYLTVTDVLVRLAALARWIPAQRA